MAREIRNVLEKTRILFVVGVIGHSVANARARRQQLNITQTLAIKPRFVQNSKRQSDRPPLKTEH